MHNFLNKSKQSSEIASRTIAFFDAVLAIAITMIALEIQVPDQGPLNALQYQTFFEQSITYLISFYVLGSLWFFHMQFFSTGKYIMTGTNVVLHLVLMMLVCLYPTATRLVLVSRQFESQLIYVGIFTLMQILDTAVIWQARTETNAKAQAQEHTIDRIDQMMKNIRDPKLRAQYEEYQKLRKALEERNILSDSDRADMELMIQSEKLKKKFILQSSLINIVAVYLSVFLLMDNIVLALIPIACALILIVLLHKQMKNKQKKNAGKETI